MSTDAHSHGGARHSHAHGHTAHAHDYTVPDLPEAVDIFDTILRDGSQQEGLSLTVADKLRVAEQLDHLGVTFIEGGWPGANPKDIEFFARARQDADDLFQDDEMSGEEWFELAELYAHLAERSTDGKESAATQAVRALSKALEAGHVDRLDGSGEVQGGRGGTVEQPGQGVLQQVAQ